MPEDSLYRQLLEQLIQQLSNHYQMCLSQGRWRDAEYVADQIIEPFYARVKQLLDHDAKLDQHSA